MIQAKTEPSRAAAIGMFDGVHRGHRALVRELVALARERDMIPTIFTFDRHPLELTDPEHAPKLLTTPMQRGQLLHHYGAEDVFVLVFNQALRDLTAREMLEALRDHYGVHLLVMGFNHRFGSDKINSAEEYARLGHEVGVEVVKATSVVAEGPDRKPVCSSDIRRLIAEGDVTEANRKLGHPYRLSGVVVHGYAIGSTIGFPTANLSQVAGRQLMAGEGVYAAAAVLPELDAFTDYPAMVNIGYRPTVNESLRSQKTVETHIIGFDGDIYGHALDLRLLKRLRGEQKFASLDQLREQLEKDKAETMKVFESKQLRSLD